MHPNSREENKAAFESMFEHASIGILISNTDGKIERVNAAAGCIFGYGLGELVGQRIEVLIPTPLRGKHLEHREKYNHQMTARPMGMGMDLSAIKKDGTAFPVEISLASYETKSGREIVSFVSDITKRKKDEEALRALTEELENKVAERTEALSQAIKELQQMNENLGYEMEQRKKAEEEVRQALEKEKDLSELKSRFVSMASHEFRTPLSGVLTSVSLIERYNQAGDPEKIGKHIQTIKASVHSLTTILNDFLSLDKLEAGCVERHPSVFAVDELASDLAQEMRSLAKKGQRLLYEHHGKKESVFLDREILRNVLINLLSNAMKYSPEGAEIRFSTELQERGVVITVKDMGIGIPEAEQKHLFERFFRARNAGTIQGTGLGLNIVKRYLNLMGGTIDYTSQENVGTTFTVVLPRKIAT